MSGPKLRPIYPNKFDAFVKLCGYQTEYEFWQALSGSSGPCIHDLADGYLSSLGYNGFFSDKLRSFLQDQTSMVAGTMFDKANKFFEAAYSPVTPTGDYILMEDGSILTAEDGSNVEKE